MKILSINSLLPMMALLAVGCSSPLALQTSESDDVYFSSKDQVVLPGETAARTEPGTRSRDQGYAYDPETGEPLNPEYSEGAEGQDGYAANEYRDESYSDVFVSQNVRPRYHMPFNRYGSMAMMDPFFNPYYPMAHRSFMNPYWGGGMMHDPFYAYDPFFMPRGGFGMGFGIGFGMGYGMGYGMSPFMNPFMDPFMGYGMMSPYGMSPWGYNRMMRNSYYMGYNHGIYRQYYANHDAFEPQRTVYAPRNARNVSPVSRGDLAGGRPDAANRVGTNGGRGTNSNNAVDGQAARTGRAVDTRGNVRTDGARPARGGERPALNNRPQTSPDQQAARPANPTRYRTERATAQPQQSRSQRTEYSAPVRTTTPDYQPRTSSPSYSQPSYSRPSMSSPSGGGGAPSGGGGGGGRPSRR